MSKKGAVTWTPQQLAEYEKRRGVVPSPVAVEPMETKLKRRRRRKMNGTEERFSEVLGAMFRRDEIAAFGFEEMTLRYGKGEDFTYTPDFTVIVSVLPANEGKNSYLRLRFIEVKGAHIRQKDWDRFKHCRDNFPLYEFELWQWKQRTWTRLS